ncbi:hypothetical protein D6C94_04337 [Aureobasidium pullulans]|uniref:Ubiquitin-protein ligase n=1 Tax=Aureobasidium pullulans TaxID=5580 RepID=A0AB38LZ93_AURPU|nr:hypothetical protein D6C94_04337 [Aureobasidium pullulans]
MSANSSLVPSSSDLLLLVPRLARNMVHLAQRFLPDQNMSAMAPDATPSQLLNMTASLIQQPVTSAAAPAAAATASTQASSTGFMSYLTLPWADGIKGFGGMFAYIGSRWALATFAISIFLNRTHFYASSRQNLNPRWHTRLLLYSGPVLLLSYHVLCILQTLKCQTSPDYPLLRYGDPNKNLAINFGGDGGFVHHFSSSLLFWKSDAECCRAMNMSLQDDKFLDVMGSFSLLWPLFLTLCFSQFIETLNCALQGRQPLPETGMTTFEHSLAFAESEAMLTNALGLGIFGPADSTSRSNADVSDASDISSVLLTKSMVLQRLNVPSEVLLIALISCLSHISSAVLAITGRRHQLRLVNTAIWAMCYMTAFCWSLVNALSSPLGPHDLGIIRFPTVCIIGFIPHMLIILGIMVCSLIYGVALLLNALSLPPHAPPNPSIKERFSIAFNNMQANVQFSSVSSMRLSWTEDFYTVLLKIGFNVLTAASESVFLNEGSKIQIHAMTWLEEERIQEFTSMLEDRRRASLIPSELLDERIAKGLSFTDHKTMPSMSGFATERRSKSSADTASRGTINNDNGLGIAERRGRWQLSFEFMKGLLLLLVSINGRLALSCLSMLGIERVPNWLTRAADYRRSPASASTKQRNGQQASTPDFWLVSERGVLSLPEDGNVDVEDEMRRRLRAQGLPGAGIAEDAVDDDLYQWWKRGGWWGDLDNSGSYEAREQDDDTTSMISMSTNAPSEADSEEDSGRRTPTQEDYIRSREQSPSGLKVADLARLLDPKTTADREEAQMLARHLQSEQPMTRSQYRRRMNRDKARVLDTPYLESAFKEGTDGAMSTAAEAETLEKFLLERRLTKRQQEPEGGAGSWDSGAEGMGSSGPQCVVCQSSPRVIVAWPCGCLCVCDECRVGVATRNFTKCMCCRTKVVAFSRLFVP